MAGIGISMALPTVPTAVLSSVAEIEMGKASGISYMSQRFGAVFAIAIASAVFSAHGNLSNPAAVTAGFRPGLWSCAIFAALAALTSVAIGTRAARGAPRPTHPTSSSMPNQQRHPTERTRQCPTSCTGSASTPHKNKCTT